MRRRQSSSLSSRHGPQATKDAVSALSIPRGGTSSTTSTTSTNTSSGLTSKAATTSTTPPTTTMTNSNGSSRGLVGRMFRGEEKKEGHNVHVDSNPGSFPGFPNLNFNFFDTQPEHQHCSTMTSDQKDDHNDKYNYALLLALYTLQGIPMGLSASIPFLIQQKVKQVSTVTTATKTMIDGAAAAATAATASTSAASVSRMAYNAQAIFALCSWPFSLKLLWAPIVDSIFLKKFGRRKSWLVPAQTFAGLLMVSGSNYVEQQLGLGSSSTTTESVVAGTTTTGNIIESTTRQLASETASAAATASTTTSSFDVKGVTIFFFALYFLMATQDIAVDGWALTMLSKKNRGKGPICNSIGQNLGYFLSFVGFLALNDVDSSENLWRPLLGLKSQPGVGLVSLGSFVKFMGIFMLVITTFVAIFKKEIDHSITTNSSKPVSSTITTSSTTNDDSTSTTKSLINNKTNSNKQVLNKENSPSSSFMSFLNNDEDEEDDDDAELDASKIGLHETYKRLWSVCQLSSVKWLFLILLTYRLPTALSDNVKFLKAVEYGLSKQTTALLSPLIVLPLGIIVPIVAAKVWKGAPLQQFLTAYKLRVSLVAVVDMAMLYAIKYLKNDINRSSSQLIVWTTVIGSTALQATMQSLQFNAQMTFFASRVDPAIGGSYMTLLNTAANLGGTWPSSVVMYLVGTFTRSPTCNSDNTICEGGRDAYFPLQIALSMLGLIWLFCLSHRIHYLSNLPDDAWRTHISDLNENHEPLLLGDGSTSVTSTSKTTTKNKNKNNKDETNNNNNNNGKKSR